MRMNFKNAVKSGVVFLMSICSGWAYAQENANTSSQNTSPNWIVNCNNRVSPDKLSCSMSQTIHAAKTRQRIATATLVNSTDGLLMVMALPHGLNLLAGVKLSVDEGEPETIPFHTADANGSYARLILSPEMLQTFRAGKLLSSTVTGNSGNVIILEMSLSGFSKSLTLMQK